MGREFVPWKVPELMKLPKPGKTELQTCHYDCPVSLFSRFPLALEFAWACTADPVQLIAVVHL